MKQTTRSFLAMIIAGLILWSILNYSLLFRMPWWSFLLILGFSFLVVDAGLQALVERFNGKP